MRFLVLSLFFLIGCTRVVYVPVVQSRTLVDTVMQTYNDSALFQALFISDSSGNILLKELNHTKGKTAEQKVEFEDNKLTLKTQWQTKFIERQVEVRDTVTVVDVRNIVEQKPYIPKFFWGCFVIALLFVVWGVWRVVKIFL